MPRGLRGRGVASVAVFMRSRDRAGGTAVGRAAVEAGVALARGHQFATTLMRAIISSTALSTGTFSLRMRFMALAQTFSLFSTVNL